MSIDHGFKPDVATVQAVTQEILAEVGSEMMSQCWSAIPDLLWDHYDPYQRLPKAHQEAWQQAFKDELEGGYEG